MKSEVKKIGKHQLEITITVPHQRVGDVLEKVYQDWGKEVEIKGFRKGQAPPNRVREKLDQSKVYGEVVNRLVPEAYNAAVKEHLLKPIVSPRIEIIQFEPEAKKDFIFKATTAERPEVQLGDYKNELKKLSSKGRPASGRNVQKPSEGIVGPDGQPLKESSPAPEPALGNVLAAVLSTSKVQVPDLLIENEVHRMLSRLIDQTARLGLTIEQYLQSQNKTAEQLRADYARQAEENLKAELVLDELARAEKIEVTDKEIEEAINAAPNEASKKELAKEENKWYIKSILKRNRTLQRLLDLTK